jgi:hypothetical protein
MPASYGISIVPGITPLEAKRLREAQVAPRIGQHGLLLSRVDIAQFRAPRDQIWPLNRDLVDVCQSFGEFNDPGQQRG